MKKKTNNKNKSSSSTSSSLASSKKGRKVDDGKTTIDSKSKKSSSNVNGHAYRPITNSANIPSTSTSTSTSTIKWIKHPIIYAGIAALIAIIVPLFLFHNDAPLSFLHHDHDRAPRAPSSPPHAAPNASRSTRLTTSQSQDDDVRTDYESGISSFDNYVDPHLTMMNFTLPGGTVEETFMAYVTPDVSTFYRDGNDHHDDNNDDDGHGPKMENRSRKRKPKKMNWKGLAGKFVNLSPEKMVLNWDDGKGTVVYIATAPPFEAVSTATYVGHQFHFAPEGDTENIKWRCSVIKEQNVYSYDPFTDDDDDVRREKASLDLPAPRSLESLKRKQRKRYDVQRRNLDFSKEYRKVTGREYLGLYPTRLPPMHKMWNADYFGQQHWVTTSETHFTELPPNESLGQMSSETLKRRLSDSDPRPLHQHRSPQSTLNLTLTVLSCAPRVFEIREFLSPIEVDHIVHMATGLKLQVSSTSGGGGGSRLTDEGTRSSRNSWVNRHRSLIIDSIYRRAADIMRIDEALLRERGQGERKDVGFRSSVAEELQLVHYGPGQQYTPHHDFSHPSQGVDGQPARFATLLLYLNDDVVGGHTEFQRWMNSETGVPLSVKPEVGKAVLFYDLLPDGNMDDFSQHSATPVMKGEKWLINLWTWDPRFSHG